MYFPIYVNPGTFEISLEPKEGFTHTALPKKSDGIDGRWMWSTTKVLSNKHLVIPKLIGKRDEWDIFVKDYLLQDGEERSRKVKTIWSEKEFNTQNGTVEVKSLFGNKYFEYPKPTALLKKMVTAAGVADDDLVLDFFAGSGTTAQAVLELNEEDGGNRQFILVQMPEELDAESEAYKAGYRTIADICTARIRKVIEKLAANAANKRESEKSQNQMPLGEFAKISDIRGKHRTDGTPDANDANQRELEQAKNQPQLKFAQISEIRGKLNRGFQSFRIAPSNFKQWRGDITGKDAILEQLDIFRHSEKETSESEKMLYEILLKAGFPLTAKIETAQIQGQPVYVVEDGKLLAFFDGYHAATKEYIHQRKPQRVVCLDRVFNGDDQAISNLKLELKEADIELTII